jgi:hypothetical protein
VKAMDCRKFHKYLEDYLQDRLDFSGRFGMERHAQQCFRCGKDMANAQELRRMVLELKRVKAPADFESSLLAKIGTYKAHSRFPAFDRFWIYGPDWLSWKKLMLATSSLAVLTLGIVFSIHMAVQKPITPAPMVARQPEKSMDSAKPLPAVKAEQSVPAPSHAAVNTRKVLPALTHTVANEGYSLPMPVVREIPKAVAVSHVPGAEPEFFDDQQALETDYFEFMISGSDIRPLPVRMLPKKIRIQYRPASEEYFIQNVSH